MSWEYTTCEFYSYTPEANTASLQFLNTLGSQGWEAVGWAPYAFTSVDTNPYTMDMRPTKPASYTILLKRALPSDDSGRLMA